MTDFEVQLILQESVLIFEDQKIWEMVGMLEPCMKKDSQYIMLFTIAGYGQQQQQRQQQHARNVPRRNEGNAPSCGNYCSRAK